MDPSGTGSEGSHITMENICNPTVAPQHDGGYPSNQARPRVIPPVVRRLRSNRALAPQRPVTAIAVHAGAGFHSHANEAFHLQACNEYESTLSPEWIPTWLTSVASVLRGWR